jgi:hypothetical protein
VVKFDRVRLGAPTTVILRQNLARCGSGGGPTDVAVDARGSTYVACAGGSVARALVVRCTRTRSGDKKAKG